jgi:hypothetical protein
MLLGEHPLDTRLSGVFVPRSSLRRSYFVSGFRHFSSQKTGSAASCNRARPTSFRLSPLCCVGCRDEWPLGSCSKCSKGSDKPRVAQCEPSTTCSNSSPLLTYYTYYVRGGNFAHVDLLLARPAVNHFLKLFLLEDISIFWVFSRLP